MLGLELRSSLTLACRDFSSPALTKLVEVSAITIVVTIIRNIMMTSTVRNPNPNIVTVTVIISNIIIAVVIIIIITCIFVIIVFASATCAGKPARCS